MKLLKRYIDTSETKPDFLTVAGDNYYFVKNKKTDIKGKEKVFKPDIFVINNESKTISNIQNLLSAIPAAADWKVNSEVDGSDEVKITNKDGKVIALFDLDSTDKFGPTKAETYLNDLINIIIANTKDEDKATTIEGKQRKAEKTISSSRATTSTSQPATTTTTTEVKIVRPKKK